MKSATKRRGRRPIGRRTPAAVRPRASAGFWFVMTRLGPTPVRRRTPDAVSLAEASAASGWSRADLAGLHELVMAIVAGRITTAEILAQVTEYQRQQEGGRHG